MLKKIILTVLMLCLVFCAAAHAEAIAFTLAGAGTEESPYLIATQEDLLQLAAVMNDEDLHSDYMYGHYQLTADIELNDCSAFDSWAENAPENIWTPIGYYHSFKGVFDGSGHTISGLCINQPVTEIKYDGYSRVIDKFGLFAKNDGEIKNLTIANAFVAPEYVKDLGSIDAGILAGYNSGSIHGCTVKGIVVCEGFSNGGIAGGNYGEIADCTFEGKLLEKSGSHSTNIGGIAGSGGIIRNCTVSAQLICENTTETEAYANIGGITGMLSAFIVDECIEYCTFSGEIVSGNYAGGIAGHAGTIGANEDGAKAVIRGCTNNGSITSVVDAGGIVGTVMIISNDNEVLIEGCSNFGEVHTLTNESEAAGGIVGSIDTRNNGQVLITGCTNEAALRANMPGGIVGSIMQQKGNIRIEKCTNKGAITCDGFYAAGILCHIQQWGGNWNIEIDQCVNEGDIFTPANAGGIVCFAFDADANASGRALTISNCANRGNLCSSGNNNYMGGILGVNALAKIPVTITGCVNEGNLEYTSEVLVDAETLSGTLVTLARTSGGIVGYVGTAPYFSLNSGERSVENINVDDAFLNIVNCSSTGRFIHKEAAFADDVDETIIEKWNASGYDNVLNFFVALEGGIVGTVADDGSYSVNISDCTFENIERAWDDWNRFDTGKNS